MQVEGWLRDLGQDVPARPDACAAVDAVSRPPASPATPKAKVTKVQDKDKDNGKTASLASPPATNSGSCKSGAQDAAHGSGGNANSGSGSRQDARDQLQQPPVGVAAVFAAAMRSSGGDGKLTKQADHDAPVLEPADGKVSKEVLVLSLAPLAYARAAHTSMECTSVARTDPVPQL